MQISWICSIVLLKRLLYISASKILSAITFLMLPQIAMGVEIEYANRQMSHYQLAIDALNSLSP